MVAWVIGASNCVDDSVRGVALDSDMIFANEELWGTSKKPLQRSGYFNDASRELLETQNQAARKISKSLRLNNQLCLRIRGRFEQAMAGPSPRATLCNMRDLIPCPGGATCCCMNPESAKGHVTDVKP